ncbi:YadA C-terminal domain-containing protein [Oceanivirga miroungae]|uniref:Adhesin YadA n=1 Tax=Oceanivirga miroungae TaxID=1130046 RepID=A0A6I8MC60_9FUSO|nr:YadA C-terminal domain-containing protein [Oceanivirga miroungae]VWL85037.1 Adhesin YadA [Oceanivirga miroungae]VWL85041.1 Adhesin YadA [Oceanivirga miroungae]
MKLKMMLVGLVLASGVASFADANLETKKLQLVTKLSSLNMPSSLNNDIMSAKDDNEFGLVEKKVVEEVNKQFLDRYKKFKKARYGKFQGSLINLEDAFDSSKDPIVTIYDKKYNLSTVDGAIDLTNVFYNKAKGVNAFDKETETLFPNNEKVKEIKTNTKKIEEIIVGEKAAITSLDEIKSLPGIRDVYDNIEKKSIEGEEEDAIDTYDPFENQDDPCENQDDPCEIQIEAFNKSMTDEEKNKSVYNEKNEEQLLEKIKEGKAIEEKNREKNAEYDNTLKVKEGEVELTEVVNYDFTLREADFDAEAVEKRIVISEGKAIQQNEQIRVELEKTNAEVAKKADKTYVDGSLKSLGEATQRGLAEQAALSSLLQPVTAGKGMITAGFGGHNKSVAVAVGLGYKFNNKFSIRAGLSTSFKSVSYNASLGYEF